MNTFSLFFSYATPLFEIAITITVSGATKKRVPKTPEEKRTAAAERMARGRASETPEKREERLRRDRDRASVRRGKKRLENVEMERAEETPEEEQQRQLRESYQRMVEMEEEDEELMFTRETPAEREERLRKDRERHASRRERMTEEEVMEENEARMARKKKTRGGETEEQRAQRKQVSIHFIYDIIPVSLKIQEKYEEDDKINK